VAHSIRASSGPMGKNRYSQTCEPSRQKLNALLLPDGWNLKGKTGVQQSNSNINPKAGKDPRPSDPTAGNELKSQC
jgi:hypothetical protein